MTDHLVLTFIYDSEKEKSQNVIKEVVLPIFEET